MASGMIDIKEAGNYPIVLSDALLGKSSKEIYTAVRYNHKHEIIESSPSDARLKPSDNDPAGYDLSLEQNSDKYKYQGTRTSASGQYVLIFDPAKEHFVLHKVDSTFDMNVTNTPWSDDSTYLRSEYPQIGAPPSKAKATQRKAPKATKKAATDKTIAPRKKAAPKKAKPAPVREPTPDEMPESDDGLTIEYPDGPPGTHHEYDSTPVFQRALSEDVSDEDAEGEEYEDELNQDVDLLKLPSPANNNVDELSEQDMEDDLEAELEQALNGGDESDESEEE